VIKIKKKKGVGIATGNSLDVISVYDLSIWIYCTREYLKVLKSWI